MMGYMRAHDNLLFTSNVKNKLSVHLRAYSVAKGISRDILYIKKITSRRLSPCQLIHIDYRPADIETLSDFSLYVFM